MTSPGGQRAGLEFVEGIIAIRPRDVQYGCVHKRNDCSVQLNFTKSTSPREIKAASRQDGSPFKHSWSVSSDLPLLEALMEDVFNDSS